MKSQAAFLALLLFIAGSPASAVQLVPPASGLSSPVYLTHSIDGSGRRYIAERGGIVRLLRPGTSSPTVFLDVRGNLVSGDEQGLLGLAFHPACASNGRLFAYYTSLDTRSAMLAQGWIPEGFGVIGVIACLPS